MEKLKTIVDQFTNCKVLVVGDAILDTYVKGTIDRICREAPVPVFNVHEQEPQCGGAANTAINLATLGAQTYFLTVTGKDAEAKEMMALLKKGCVDTSYAVQDKSRKTLSKKRITASSSILLRVDEGSTHQISEACEMELLKRFEELYQQVDAVVLSDYGYGILTTRFLKSIKTIIESNYKPVVVDAKDLRRFQQLQPSAVKPNYEEALRILGLQKLARSNRVQQIQSNAGKLHELTGAEKIAVTLDSEGVLYLEKTKEPYYIECVPADNKKAIGAGDTFVSALVLSLASDAPGDVAAEIAASAAAVVVQKEGTAGCTNHELQAYFNAVPKYVLCESDLATVVADIRKQGKKIVFTNGCFDILHKGHVTLLNKARQLGDVLIVGINSDESIRKLKGPERPINSLEDRITVLAGLQSVDYLMAFREESPEKLIKIVRPDVFVKGGDYTEDSIPEAQLVKKLGGTIAIVPYVIDHSTTNIIKKIKVDSEAQSNGKNHSNKKVEVS